MVMLLVTSLLTWWYTDGWRSRARLVSNRLDATIDYFSFDLLLKTLFAPFRQISAGSVDGPLEVKLRALVDKLFSRIIGAFIRLVILFVGGIVVTLQVLVGLVMLIAWMIVPLLPLLGLTLFLIGRTL